MNFNTDQLKEQHKRSLLHPASVLADIDENGPAQIMSDAKGCYVTDTDGVKKLDMMAGLWCMDIGYGRPEIAEVLSEMSTKIGYYHSFAGMSNPWQIELADRLRDLTGDSLGKTFFGQSGSDANDTMIKLVWYYHGLMGNAEKVKILVRHRAYHGTGIASASLTQLPNFHAGFALPMNDRLVGLTEPHYYKLGKDGETEEDFVARLANELEDTIQREGADTIGAFIAEPIQGAGGVIPAAKGYFDAIVPILKKHNILFICDEVITGFGRMGEWFGHQALNIEPDMMTIAKGLTSGYFPLSGAMVSDEIYEVISKKGTEVYKAFAHGYTYSGHPMGAAVALKNLDIIEQENLVGNSADVGAYMHEQLRTRILQHPNVGEIRGTGLIAGIQLMKDADNKVFNEGGDIKAPAVVKAIMEQGVITRPLPISDSIAMSPPLCITREEVDEAINAIAAGLDAVYG